MHIIQDPGPWMFYHNKPENKNLNIHQLKRKYLCEQQLYLQQVDYYNNWLLAQGGNNDNWTLNNGNWDDNGLWDDDKKWND
jgi:Ca2+-binding RTX toxin-like protein